MKQVFWGENVFGMGEGTKSQNVVATVPRQTYFEKTKKAFGGEKKLWGGTNYEKKQLEKKATAWKKQQGIQRGEEGSRGVFVELGDGEVGSNANQPQIKRLKPQNGGGKGGRREEFTRT